MFQRWSLSRCIRRGVSRALYPFVGFGIAASVAATGAGKGSSVSENSHVPELIPELIPELLREVEAKYSRASTLVADFSQTNEIVALKQKKTSSGHIMFKRPDKVRWETRSPDMNVMVSDGRKVWFYTPPFDEGESGQVVERSAAEAKSRLANALLSGSFSMAKDIRIKQTGPFSFRVIPKVGTAGTVVRAEIGIDSEKKLISKVVLDHKGGNRTEITLSAIELGKALGDELFIFTPPPGTDRLSE